MPNPFEELQAQLNRIENLMVQILQREPVVQSPGPENPIGIDEVATILGLSVSAVYQNKAIPRHKVAGTNRVWFYKSEILAFTRESASAPVTLNEHITRRPQRNRRAAALGQ